MKINNVTQARPSRLSAPCHDLDEKKSFFTNGSWQHIPKDGTGKLETPAIGSPRRLGQITGKNVSRRTGFDENQGGVTVRLVEGKIRLKVAVCGGEYRTNHQKNLLVLQEGSSVRRKKKIWKRGGDPKPSETRGSQKKKKNGDGLEVTLNATDD